MRLIDADRLLAKLVKRRVYIRRDIILGDLASRQRIYESEHVSEVVERMAQNAIDLVKHGQWIVHTNQERTYGECSLCKSEQGAGILNYCPYCGAKMDEVSEGERREPQET